MKDFYKKILDNNKEWVEQSLAKDPNYFQDLAKGQTPPLLWIGCSDSRVPANESLALNQVKYLYTETLPIWSCIPI